MASSAWANQSKSLVEVQKKGKGLETEVREILRSFDGWTHGKVVYDLEHDYKLQTDAVYPSVANPEVIVSITYTNPDKKGHSNENKFQLKVGELALIKNAHPEIRVAGLPPLSRTHLVS